MRGTWLLEPARSVERYRSCTKSLEEGDRKLSWERRVDSRINVTRGGSRQVLVDSRLRLPSRVKKFVSFFSIPFFNAKGSSPTCCVRIWFFRASGRSGLSSKR